MNKNYLIYDSVSGDVSAMIQTDDPRLMSLNTPSGHEFIVTTEKNLEEIVKVDIDTKEIYKTDNFHL